MMMKSTKEDMLAWMLDKVKTSANPYEAESWLLTARTLGLNYDIDVSDGLICLYLGYWELERSIIGPSWLLWEPQKT